LIFLFKFKLYVRLSDHPVFPLRRLKDGSKSFVRVISISKTLTGLEDPVKLAKI